MECSNPLIRNFFGLIHNNIGNIFTGLFGDIDLVNILLHGVTVDQNMNLKKMFFECNFKSLNNIIRGVCPITLDL